jgi:hypothetical protein
VRGFSPWLLGFTLVVGLALLHRFAGLARDDHAETLESGPLASTHGTDPARGGTVLIVEVESRDLLERLRRRFPRARLLVSERDVVAIEGCIFTYDLEAVSGPLNRLGWSNRRIDLVTRPRGPRAEAAALPSAPAPGSNLIADLAKKPELSRGDALALLRELEP